MLQHNIPVVLTGSQLPITPSYRRQENLFCAFSMAASGKHGVFVAFNRKVMLGTRAVSPHNGYRCLESSTAHVATVGANGLEINRYPAGRLVTLPWTSWSRMFFCSRLFRGKYAYSVYRAMEYKGIIVEALERGAAFVRRNLISELKAAVDEALLL